MEALSESDRLRNQQQCHIQELESVITVQNERLAEASASASANAAENEAAVETLTSEFREDKTSLQSEVQSLKSHLEFLQESLAAHREQNSQSEALILALQSQLSNSVGTVQEQQERLAVSEQQVL